MVADMCPLNFELHMAQRQAQNRDGWLNVVEMATLPKGARSDDDDDDRSRPVDIDPTAPL